MAKEGGKEGNGWMTAAATGIAGGIQGIFNGMSMKRRYKYAKKMADYEQGLQKELNTFNQGLALDTWNKTNVEAQRKHMENAGLNVGLMYGMGGAGGATTQSGAGGSGGSMNMPESMGEGMAIQSAIQTALQAKMQEAQIKNLEANTEKTKVEAQKTAGVDTEKATAETELSKQAAVNAKTKNAVDELERQMKEIERNIAKETEQNLITKSNAELWKAVAEVKSAEAKGEIDQATKDEMIKKAEQDITEQQIRMLAQKKGMQVNDAQMKQIYSVIENMKQQTEIDWKKLSVQEAEQKVRQKVQEFSTGTAAETQQAVNIVTSILTAGIGGQGGGNPIGFKY